MLLSSTTVQRFHQGPPDPVHAVGSGTRVATRVHHSVPHRAAPLPSEPPGPWRPLSSSRPRFCLFQDVTDQSRAARRRLRPAPSLSVVGFLSSGSLTISPPPRRGPRLPAASLQAETLPRAAGRPASEDSGRHAPVLRGVGRRATAALSGLDGSLHSATAPWLVSPWELGSGREGSHLTRTAPRPFDAFVPPLPCGRAPPPRISRPSTWASRGSRRAGREGPASCVSQLSPGMSPGTCHRPLPLAWSFSLSSETDEDTRVEFYGARELGGTADVRGDVVRTRSGLRCPESRREPRRGVSHGERARRSGSVGALRPLRDALRAVLPVLRHCRRDRQPRPRAPSVALHLAARVVCL